jgi:hypothetical protein
LPASAKAGKHESEAKSAAETGNSDLRTIIANFPRIAHPRTSRAFAG